jgi:sterol desaturase/sphingolipid hydroxylase (fatty acid hydroxylase superfamily)
MPELLPHVGLIFIGLALVSFVGAAVWETRRPLFLATPQLPQRWAGNFGLFVGSHLVGYVTVPLMSVLAAWHAQWMGGTGLDAAGAALGWQFLATLLLLDAVRWAVHWAWHHNAWLWRVHQVHHCDTEFDCTVGVRFHPLETLVVAVLSSAAVLLLGASPLAVVLAEAVFIAHNFFCHANAALPPRAEALLRRCIVTPDLHRVHHAADPALANLNFGTVLTLWDRLAGTLHTVPSDAQPRLRFGVKGVDGEWTRSLWRLLLLPLRRNP